MENGSISNPTPAQHRQLYTYYSSLESRIGYKFLLGDTRHFGYWKEDTFWPFPIASSLRRMEDHLFKSLKLRDGDQVLDAGCGVGHVAIFMRKKGLKVRCIDLMDRHIEKARRNVIDEGLDDILIEKGDYHDLAVPDRSVDGVYTMETFVHSTDPKRALTEFYRVLQPGGTLALYEYDHLDKMPREYDRSMKMINKYAAMPANQGFQRGVLESLVTEAGFEDVEVHDLSRSIRPMLRLFFCLAYVPYLFVILLGIERWFINVVAAVQAYRGREVWRYVVVTARKPDLQG